MVLNVIQILLSLMLAGIALKRDRDFHKAMYFADSLAKYMESCGVELPNGEELADFICMQEMKEDTQRTTRRHPGVSAPTASRSGQTVQ